MYPTGYSQYAGYVYQRRSNVYQHLLTPTKFYNPLPNNRISYRARSPYTYGIVAPSVPTAPTLKSINVVPAQPVAPAKSVIPFQTPVTPTEGPGSSANEESKKGFKLLDDLVETVSQASGTATDSDVAEVNAIKSIFGDVIDEVIRQIEIKFKENNLDPHIRDAFLLRSENTKKAVSDAPTQTILAAILKPYVADLKVFTAKGFEIARS